MKRLAVGAGLLSLALLTGGCLIGSEQHETRTGQWVQEGTFDQIKPGETTDAWLKTTLGEPTEKTRIDEHSEIWKYAYSLENKREGWVFLILHTSDTKTTPGAVFAELKDHVVVRKWRN